MSELSLQNCRLDQRYDILSLLGRGSYAEIYVARDALAPSDSPHSQIVVKALNVFLQNDLDSELEKTLVQNFQNEALALDRVRHPNIISRLGHGTARDMRGTVFHYLILEYLPGGDLAQASRRGGLEFAQAMDYIEQVAAGLAHAHNIGVIHRDIKPQNLLLSRDLKTVKIADFGVARLAQSDAPITRVGTNIYSPPEHSPLSVNEEPQGAYAELTPAADVYSLAKSAYVLITGESPRAFSNKPITSLPETLRQMPWADTVLGVVNRATQSDPHSRHQSVAEFWRELSQGVAVSLNESITQVRRPVGTPRAHISRGYQPNVPEKPQFNPGSIPGATHMRPAQGAQSRVMQQALPIAAVADGRPRQSPVSQSPQAQVVKRKRSVGFFRGFLIAVFALTLFSSALYVTYVSLNKSGLLSNFPLFDKTGTVTADVNLRQEPGASSTRVGLVPSGSRVRIVKMSDNWYEIVVISYGRPKESADDPSRGWINGKYVDVD